MSSKYRRRNRKMNTVIAAVHMRLDRLMLLSEGSDAFVAFEALGPKKIEHHASRAAHQLLDMKNVLGRYDGTEDFREALTSLRDIIAAIAAGERGIENFEAARAICLSLSWSAEHEEGFLRLTDVFADIHRFVTSTCCGCIDGCCGPSSAGAIHKPVAEDEPADLNAGRRHVSQGELVTV